VELAYVLNLAFVFAIATLIAGCEDDSLLVRMCSTYAIIRLRKNGSILTS
jgi:hypothetical protein